MKDVLRETGKLQEHSHPTGSMITSWADLKALAIRYQQGYVKSENFTYGVVSEFGCQCFGKFCLTYTGSTQEDE